MSVYTELKFEDIETILADYSLGKLARFTGIAAGIENSNFFVHAADGQRYVLTIFERLGGKDLPYFMRLMKHLATSGLPSPDVQVRRDASLLFDFKTAEGVKKGCIVSCLAGETLELLNEAQLGASGEALASLHILGASFAEKRKNPTDFVWLEENIRKMQVDVQNHYGTEALELLHDEFAFQQQQSLTALPKGIIHGDLFCDNILFEGDKVSGMIDFYYAHDAVFMMDVAIAINAQAIVLGVDDVTRMQAFLAGYTAKRALVAEEERALTGLLRLAALRFWVSRLFDALYPREGTMTQIKDPEEYRQKLLQHRAGAQ